MSKNKLAADKEYKLQHQFLMSTKLIADEAVVYPNKSELYHTNTEKRIQPIYGCESLLQL